MVWVDDDEWEHTKQLAAQAKGQQKGSQWVDDDEWEHTKQLAAQAKGHQKGDWGKGGGWPNNGSYDGDWGKGGASSSWGDERSYKGDWGKGDSWGSKGSYKSDWGTGDSWDNAESYKGDWGKARGKGDYGGHGKGKGGGDSSRSHGGKGEKGRKGNRQPDEHDVQKAVAVMEALGLADRLTARLAKGQGKTGKLKQALEQLASGKKHHKLGADLPQNRWKSRLAAAYGKAYKAAPTKESLVYTTAKSEGGGWTCVLRCDRFVTEYASESPCDSEKLAMETVAMNALQSEYPEVYAELPGSVKNAGARAGLSGAGSATARKAVVKERRPLKRKADSTPGAGRDAKSRLNSGMQVVCDRPITKGEIEYSATEVDDTTVATVTLNCFDDKPVFTGQPVPGTSQEAIRMAEHSAAEEALKEYAKQIDDAIPEFQARKEIRRKQNEERWLQRDEEGIGPSF